MDLHEIKDDLVPVIQEILKDKSLGLNLPPLNASFEKVNAQTSNQNSTQSHTFDALNDANICILADRIINILITNDLFKMQLEELINQSINKKMRDQEQKIKQQERQIEEMEQYSRRNCVVIHGLKHQNEENETEDTDDTAIKFFKNDLNIEVKMTDIDRSHRLPSKNKPLIVKFVRHNMKSKIFAAKKNLRGKPIYLTESLTKTRLNCIRQLKEFKENKLIFSYWSWDGKLYYTKEKNGAVFTVKNFLEFQLS